MAHNHQNCIPSSQPDMPHKSYWNFLSQLILELFFICFVSPRPTGSSQTTKVSSSHLPECNKSQKFLFPENHFSKQIPLSYSFILLYKMPQRNTQMNFPQPQLVNLISMWTFKTQAGPKWDKQLDPINHLQVFLWKLDILNISLYLSFHCSVRKENCHS